MSRTVDNTITPELLREARDIVDHYAKKFDWNWEGIAPSYLTADMPIGYETAETLLLELEAEGLLFDNGNGSTMTRLRSDGTTVRNRFYPTAWLDKLDPEARQRYDEKRAHHAEWDRRVHEWDEAHIPAGTHFIMMQTAKDLRFYETGDIDGYLALREHQLQKQLGRQHT